MSGGITIVQAARQAGKTTTLVEWVKAGPGRVIITPDEGQAAFIRRKFDLTSAQVLSAHARDRLAGYGQLANRVAVDNLDHWLWSQFGQVEMVSVTAPVVVTQPEHARFVEWHEVEWEEPSDLLEDEDGAPYPEHVQEVVRSLRMQVEELRLELARTQAKAERNEQGLLSMAAALLPEPPRPQACPECLQGKHDNCDGSTWDSALDQPGLCPCYKAGHQ